MTDEQKQYLEEVINEYAKEFQKNDNYDSIYHARFYVENRNVALIDKAEDWEKTDEDLYRDRNKIKNIEELIINFLDDKTNSEKLLIAAHFGIGKTSFIRKLAHDIAKERLYDNTIYFPILIFASEGLTLMGRDLERYVKHSIKLRSNNPILVILDGLDEYSSVNTGSIFQLIDSIRNIFAEFEIVKTIYTTRLREDLSPFKTHKPFGTSVKAIRLLQFNREQINKYLQNVRSSLTYDSLKEKSQLDYSDLSKPLILGMLIKTLPSIEKDLQRLSHSKNLTPTIARTMIYMALFYQIFLGKANIQNSPNEEIISFYEEKRVLRRLAYLKQVDKDVTEEKISRWYGNGLDIEKLKFILNSYFIFQKPVTIIQQTEKRIQFLHKSYMEFFLAEHLIEHYIYGNLHLLNIGKPSEVTIDFLRGFLELLTLPDVEIKKDYVLFDKSNPNTLFYSLGYYGSSIENVGEAIDKINFTARNSFNNENIITVNTENKFYINLDGSENNSPLDKDIEKLFWKENLNSEINSIESLWVQRWTSLFILSKLDPYFRGDNGKLMKLIRSTSQFIPSYIKNGINFSSIYFGSCPGIDLSGSHISNAEFTGANLVGANLSNTRISRIVTGGGDDPFANLSGANFEHANLISENHDRQQLDYVILVGVDFSFANLSRVGLSHSDLSRSKLSWSYIKFG